MKASWFLAFLGLLAIWRLIELAISRKNAFHHGERFKVRREPLYRWMVTLHAGMFVLLPLELWWRQPQASDELLAIAGTMTLVALGLRAWTLISIGRSWNVRIIGGEGYPICSRGPYRWIRHPNYLVVVLELAWIPLLAGLWVSALVLSAANAAVLFFRIRTEEAALRENPVWLETMAHKPRFLPYLF